MRFEVQINFESAWPDWYVCCSSGGKILVNGGLLDFEEAF